MNIHWETILDEIKNNVTIALAEDIGSGDITAELLPESQLSRATVITREPCVLCGIPWFNQVFTQLDPRVQIQWHQAEGDAVTAESLLVELVGPSRSLVTGERTALNFLQLLSGTATQSRQFAQLVQNTDIKILDTRKTAVAVGGCHNHRIGLYDAFLIKENHIIACGGIGKAIERAKALHPQKPIIVEVENYVEYCEATNYTITRIMLDNFELADLEKVAQHPSLIPVEISGNITADNIQQYADMKISAISSGSLTKHVRAIDLSMRLEKISS
jgi:nicotinate-nucleotide pyrophosphorylase (carboxylating)